MFCQKDKHLERLSSWVEFQVLKLAWKKIIKTYKIFVDLRYVSWFYDGAGKKSCDG